MEPDRFDDVELHMIEEPDARGPRRGTRWALGIVAAALTAGAMAAGAWALTSSDEQTPTPAAAKPRVHAVQSYAASHAGHPCGRKQRGDASNASVRY